MFPICGAERPVSTSSDHAFHVGQSDPHFLTSGPTFLLPSTYRGDHERPDIFSPPSDSHRHATCHDRNQQDGVGPRPAAGSCSSCRRKDAAGRRDDFKGKKRGAGLPLDSQARSFTCPQEAPGFIWRELLPGLFCTPSRFIASLSLNTSPHIPPAAYMFDKAM